MKTIFVVFAILLFLLTLLSSFGGSIRKEPYYDSNPAIIVPEGFFEEQKTSMPAPPTLAKGPETDLSKLGVEEKKEKFEEEQEMNEEVPEPFEDLEEFQVGAPF